MGQESLVSGKGSDPAEGLEVMRCSNEVLKSVTDVTMEGQLKLQYIDECRFSSDGISSTKDNTSITNRFKVTISPLLCVSSVLLAFWSPCLGGVGGGGWSLCLSCVNLLAMHTLICVAFSLPPGVRGGLRLLLVALPGLVCLPIRLSEISFEKEIFYCFIN